VTTTQWLAVIGATSGLVGALTGVTSLAWQIVTHRRSGRWVEVASSFLIPVYGPTHAPEFHDDNQVAVTVTNRGGAPVTVTNCGVMMRKAWSRDKGDNMFVLERPRWATQLPAVAEPGGKPVQVLVPVDDLRRIRQERDIPFRRMRAWVDLGDGRRVYSSNTVPLAD
jgi:diadenosine tetraphosphatase ApaH/serine/threonine PP2A family protein phosphatase